MNSKENKEIYFAGSKILIENKSIYDNFIKSLKLDKNHFVNPPNKYPKKGIEYRKGTIYLFNELKKKNIGSECRIYWLEKNNRNYWVKLTLNFLFQNSESNLFHIFLWASGKPKIEESKKLKKHLEFTDKGFGYSRLLRDAVKKDNRGFEIDLSLNEDLFNDELQHKIDKLSNSKKPKTDYIDVFNKIWETKESYFDYSLVTDEEKLKKLLIDFYAYGLNKNAFKSILTEDEYKKYFVEELKYNDLKIGHELAGLGLETIKKTSNNKEKLFENLPKEKLGNLVNWYFRINILASLVKLLKHYQKPKKKLSILLIDDHPEKIILEQNIIKKWLKDEKSKNTNGILSIHKPDTLIDIKDDLDSKKNKGKKYKNHKELNDYDFILVDIDYDGEPRGFEYLHYFRSIKSVYDKPYVVVFSRNEDAASIQKALNMGALFFASKQNFAHLLLELFKVISLKEPDEKHKLSLGENWTLLYQLPLGKILTLKETVIKAEDCFEKKSDDKDPDFFKFSKDLSNNKHYKWIKKLPKAELHSHIGSVLGPELIPQTALLVLSQFYKKNNYDKKRINEIIKFIEPIASDPFLFELVETKNDYKNEIDGYKVIDNSWYKLKNLLIVDKDTQFFHQSIFNIATDTLNLKANMDNPEEVLLSPENEIIEKRYHHLCTIKNSDYFEAKRQLNKTGVKYDEVMLFFILLLEIRNKITFHKNDGKSPKEILFSIKEKINRKANEVNNGEIFDSKVIDQIEDFADILVDALGNKKNLLIHFYSDKKECNKECSILKFLISANSPQRCLHYENRGLFNYLRGCEYGGAPHLQSKESMFLVAEHIINNYALQDNIRYLDLRCAIDGYTKFGLIENEDKATEYLENAFSYWQKKVWDNGKGKKVHVNIIVTAKRHKSIKAFEKNVDLTVRHFNKKSNDDEKFWESPCKVVSFDIAGIEKGNRVSKFKKELRPLLLKCVPTTIHAGEEDTHEAIWEAVYEAHVSRIGHGLTLKDNQDLLNLVRETHVNVELCPVSNYLTNKKFIFTDTDLGKSNYPLEKYLGKRVSVSINTDNPYVSDTTLTKEFLFAAAKLSNGLTKWQLLKIILYSFKSITIPKQEKSKLLKEINEEIFELLLNEEEK